jgi:SAM-dependent methyltransferase
LKTRWQEGGLAHSVCTAEAALMAQALDDVFGFELLQLGAWGTGAGLLSQCRTRHQTIAAPIAGVGAGLICQLAHLPIASNSVDAVFVPHALETESDPHALLREADRVLVGDGQLLILGFNPRGPWGWRAAASRGGFPPGTLRLLPEGRIRDWLTLLHYEITSVRRYLYTLPLEHSVGDTSHSERSLRRGWLYPWPSGAWLMKARKRLYGMTPIRPRRRERRSVLGSALEPSA